MTSRPPPSSRGHVAPPPHSSSRRYQQIQRCAKQEDPSLKVIASATIAQELWSMQMRPTAPSPTTAFYSPIVETAAVIQFAEHTLRRDEGGRANCPNRSLVMCGMLKRLMAAIPSEHLEYRSMFHAVLHIVLGGAFQLSIEHMTLPGDIVRDRSILPRLVHQNTFDLQEMLANAIPYAEAYRRCQDKIDDYESGKQRPQVVVATTKVFVNKLEQKWQHAALTLTFLAWQHFVHYSRLYHKRHRIQAAQSEAIQKILYRHKQPDKVIKTRVFFSWRGLTCEQRRQNLHAARVDSHRTRTQIQEYGRATKIMEASMLSIDPTYEYVLLETEFFAHNGAHGEFLLNRFAGTISKFLLQIKMATRQTKDLGTFCTYSTYSLFVTLARSSLCTQKPSFDRTKLAQLCFKGAEKSEVSPGEDWWDGAAQGFVLRQNRVVEILREISVTLYSSELAAENADCSSETIRNKAFVKFLSWMEGLEKWDPDERVTVQEISFSLVPRWAQLGMMFTGVYDADSFADAFPKDKQLGCIVFTRDILKSLFGQLIPGRPEQRRALLEVVDGIAAMSRMAYPSPRLRAFERMEKFLCDVLQSNASWLDTLSY